MKKTLLTTIIFISSASFFSGCANSTPNADKKLAKENLSVYNIMGIKEPQKRPPLFIIAEDTTPNYNFVIKSHANHQNSHVSDNIEVVSYGSYSPPSYTPPKVETNTEEILNNIELNAKSFLGTKYVWGATGPTKFDCSGFTQKVYRTVGINLPRVSRNQAKVGKLVRFNELQKGDMVFFDTTRKNIGRVNHVGIYLEDGKFIHASSGNHKVVITSFDKKRFYKNHFLWGRRIIKTSSLLKLHTKLANIVNLKEFSQISKIQEL